MRRGPQPPLGGGAMEPRRGVVAFSLMCGVGVLLAAAGDTLVAPSEGIPADFAARPAVPFQSLKQVPIWNEVERLLDAPTAIGTCNSSDIAGNAQGYPARCATLA